MKNVLVVAYLYPPIFNSGTRRTLEFVNHLPDTGWIPTVLTVTNPDPRECDDTLLAEVRPGTRVERSPLMINEIARKIAGLLSPLVNQQRMEKAIEWRLHKLWRLPDATASWAPSAVAKAIALHSTTPFDAIYATGWPWTSFLIAEKISRRTGVPFVVDYRDLWKASDAEWDKTSNLQHLLQPRLERRVLKRASAVIATTKSFLKLLPQGSLPTKQYAITNGFDPGDFPAASLSREAPGGRIRIVYTGVWRPGYGPSDLYLALQNLKSKKVASLGRLMVVTAGFPPGRAREYGLEDIVTELGRVPHSQAIELMSGATALYLPVSGGLYEYASIPGKLFEYLGSGRPILASAQSGSEVASVLNQVGGTLRVNPGDFIGLASAIEKLCEGSTEALFSTRSPEQLATLTRSNLTQQLSLVLDQIAGKSGPTAINL